MSCSLWAVPPLIMNSHGLFKMAMLRAVKPANPPGGCSHFPPSLFEGANPWKPWQKCTILAWSSSALVTSSHIKSHHQLRILEIVHVFVQMKSTFLIENPNDIPIFHVVVPIYCVFVEKSLAGNPLGNPHVLTHLGEPGLRSTAQVFLAKMQISRFTNHIYIYIPRLD